jgi:hypothetical protein
MFKTTTITKLTTRKNLIIAILSLIAIIGLGGYFAYNYDVSKIQEVTLKYWEESANKRSRYLIPLELKKNTKREIVVTKYGLTNIVSTVIFIFEEFPDGRQNMEWHTFYIHRTGLFQYNLDNFNIAVSIEYKFDQAVELAKKIDVNKENPDTSKILNVPELKPPYTATDYQALEKLQKVTSETFNNLPKEERVKICQEDLAKRILYYEEQINNPKSGEDYVSPETLAYFKKAFIDEWDCSKV